MWNLVLSLSFVLYLAIGIVFGEEGENITLSFLNETATVYNSSSNIPSFDEIFFQERVLVDTGGLSAWYQLTAVGDFPVRAFHASITVGSNLYILGGLNSGLLLLLL